MENTQLPADIAKLREQIQGISDELDWTQNSPLPKAELKARVGESVKFVADQFDAGRLGALMHPASGHQPLSELLSSEVKVLTGGEVGLRHVTIPLAPVLCWALGDVLIKRLNAEVDRMDYRSGPPAAERPARIAELKRQLRELEFSEEALIVAAEDVGTYIGRRADADPSVILGYSPDDDGADLHLRRISPPSWPAGTPIPSVSPIFPGTAVK